MTRHVAIFANLGNGHIYPTLGLCDELVRRGYRVTYATNEHFAHRIREMGAEPIIFSPAKFELPEEVAELLRRSPRDPDCWPIYGKYLYPYYLTDAAVTVQQLERFFEDNVPDVILYDRLAFAGRILAKQLGVPAIQISFEFARHGTDLVRLNGVCSTPPSIVEFSRVLDGFLAEYGVEGKDSFWHVEELNIYFIPREFQYDLERYDSRSCFVGACLSRPFRRIWERSGDGKPLLLISGPSYDVDEGYFRTFVDAFSDGKYHIILSVGDRADQLSIESLPSNFEINRHAYHLEMLPYTALAVCHGGMGTVLESIYNGVPTVSIPPTPFNEEIAYRVTELGLGVHLPKECFTAEAIRNSVDSVLADCSFHGRVREMQEVFKRSEGAVEGANRIEQFLRS